MAMNRTNIPWPVSVAHIAMSIAWQRSYESYKCSESYEYSESESSEHSMAMNPIITITV